MKWVVVALACFASLASLLPAAEANDTDPFDSGGETVVGVPQGEPDGDPTSDGPAAVVEAVGVVVVPQSETPASDSNSGPVTEVLQVQDPFGATTPSARPHPLAGRFQEPCGEFKYFERFDDGTYGTFVPPVCVAP